MKLFAIFMTCFTVTATFAVVHAHADTDCKNIVQSQDAKPNTQNNNQQPAQTQAPAPVVQQAR